VRVLLDECLPRRLKRELVGHETRTAPEMGWAIEASLAGVDFYRANGFIEVGRGETHLTTGRSMECVFMRKELSAVNP